MSSRYPRAVSDSGKERPPAAPAEVEPVTQSERDRGGDRRAHRPSTVEIADTQASVDDLERAVGAHPITSPGSRSTPVGSEESAPGERRALGEPTGQDERTSARGETVELVDKEPATLSERDRAERVDHVTRSDRGAAATEARRSSGEIERSSFGRIRRGDAGRRYVLGAEIARGGMGRVVEANDAVLGRTVAIKEVLVTDDALVARFERETQITARLEHPSIIPVYDAGRSPNGAPFYVMRKVTGKPLDELVRAADTLSDRLALLPHVLAAANALAHAHGRGVIHRDLKPTNILVGRLGETVVIDWGLAKVIGEDDVSVSSVDPVKLEDDVDTLRTRVGEIVGTPGFMSPEQLRGQQVDARADVYALGATLYYLLVRRVPHSRKTGEEMMEAALAGPPVPLRELAPGVPPELATIVDRALAPGLDVRYRDAGGLAEDLDQFLKGQLVASHRYSRRERFRRWLRRHRAAVAISVIATIAIAVFGSISIARTIRERDRADRALVVTRAKNEQLQLSHALTLVRSHPTGALAIARPLATRRWETSRALAMAARATGVAYGLRASPFTRSLEMAADGIRVMSAGSDGVIRIHDLRARSSRVVAELGMDASATWASNEAVIVAWTKDKRIVVIPLAGGASREVRLEAEPWRLKSDGDAQVTWCDREKQVWTMSLATLAPQRVGVGGDEVDHLMQHGGVFALGGAKKTFLFWPAGRPDAGSTTKPPSDGDTDPRVRTIIDGHARELAFSKTGKLAAVLDDYKGPLQIVEFAPNGDKVAAMDHPDAFAIEWQGDTLWIGSERGLGTRVAIETQVRGGVHELLSGPNDTLIARTRTSAFMLFDGKTIAEIPPTYAIHELATGPTSGFVAAGSDHVVLVWTLDDVRPQSVPLTAPSTNAFAGADQIVAIHDETHGTWIELATQTRTPIDLPGHLHRVVFAPDGSSALAITDALSAVLFRRGAPGSQMIGIEITAAAFLSSTEIVVGTKSGAVRVVDLAGTTIKDLMTNTPAQPVKPDVQLGAQEIEIGGAWIAVLFKDGAIARMRSDGTVRTTLPADGKLHWIELFESGVVAYTDFATLFVWPLTGKVKEYEGLPPPVSAVRAIGPDSFIVYTGGDSAHLVELAGQGRVHAAYPPGMRMEWLKLEGDHGVYLSPDGALFETSPRTGVNWRVATPRRDRLLSPILTRDRTKLFVIAGDRLVWWNHVLPENAEQTAALFETLTNAKPAVEDDLESPTPSLRLRWE